MKVPAWLLIEPAALVLEIISIVIAILVAFAFNAWNDERKAEMAMHDSLVNVRREIASNRAGLVATMALHRRFHNGYEAYVAQHRQIDVEQFFGLFSRMAPHGFSPFAGETTAWDIARSLPSVTVMPYETRVEIQRAYAEQAFLRDEGQRIIGDLHLDAATDRPNLFLATAAMLIDSGDIIAAEQRILALYDDLLIRLPSQ